MRLSITWAASLDSTTDELQIKQGVGMAKAPVRRKGQNGYPE